MENNNEIMDLYFDWNEFQRVVTSLRLMHSSSLVNSKFATTKMVFRLILLFAVRSAAARNLKTSGL